MDLPIEIVNKIFLFVSSPTSELIRESKYYNKSFPILYLDKVVNCSLDKNISFLECRSYYQYDVYWKILEHQKTDEPTRYQLFHIFTNYKKEEAFSEDTKVNIEYFYTILVNRMNDVYYNCTYDTIRYIDNRIWTSNIRNRCSEEIRDYTIVVCVSICMSVWIFVCIVGLFKHV